MSAYYSVSKNGIYNIGLRVVDRGIHPKRAIIFTSRGCLFSTTKYKKNKITFVYSNICIALHRARLGPGHSNANIHTERFPNGIERKRERWSNNKQKNNSHHFEAHSQTPNLSQPLMNSFNNEWMKTNADSVGRGGTIKQNRQLWCDDVFFEQTMMNQFPVILIYEMLSEFPNYYFRSVNNKWSKGNSIHLFLSPSSSLPLAFDWHFSLIKYLRKVAEQKVRQAGSTKNSFVICFPQDLQTKKNRTKKMTRNDVNLMLFSIFHIYFKKMLKM